MKKLLLLSGWLIFSLQILSQNSITLSACYEKAIANYPLLQQDALLASSNELTLKNLNKNYLPQMNLNGQAHYQSDVTKVPIQDIPVFGIEPLDKDWYKIMLDVNQVIYDGNATSRQKKLEEVNHEINKQNLEIEQYNLKVRINEIYFSIILLNENKNIIELHHSTLQAKLKEVESGVKNGVILASNQDILFAEILNIEQSLEELEISRNSAISIMNEYTALELNTSTQFILPEVDFYIQEVENNRPEYQLMSIQQKKLEASKHLIGSKNLPRLSAFGQAGYGRPGYDMLKNQFDDFYMIGARLSWRFWDWNHSRKEKEILGLQQNIISTKKETFDKNIRIDLEQKLANINKTEAKISRDKQIIEIRNRIAKASSSQLDNGTITSTEYLTELNSASKAKLDHELHKIELLKAKLDYQTTLGNL
ncbi:MAG: TolC family protein [Bacteroidales bacterium]